MLNCALSKLVIVPFIVVYTQYDELVNQVKYELRSQKDEVKVDERVKMLFNESCLIPFGGEAKFPYARVSSKRASLVFGRAVVLTHYHRCYS